MIRESSITDGTCGSSLLQIAHCFEPLQWVTLTFAAERVGIEITGSDTTIREAGTVHYDNAPEWARSWESFCRFALPLEGCRNAVFDGTSYTHSVLEHGRETSVKWHSPSWLKNPLQMTVIRGYMELAETAGLRRLLQLWRSPGRAAMHW